MLKPSVQVAVEASCCFSNLSEAVDGNTRVGAFYCLTARLLLCYFFLLNLLNQSTNPFHTLISCSSHLGGIDRRAPRPGFHPLAIAAWGFPDPGRSVHPCSIHKPGL
jgi:hypothetical protein